MPPIVRIPLGRFENPKEVRLHGEEGKGDGEKWMWKLERWRGVENPARDQGASVDVMLTKRTAGGIWVYDSIISELRTFTKNEE